MSTQIQIRRDTTANWEGVNPTMADGEVGYDTTENKFKVGNGLDDWNSLSYTEYDGDDSRITNQQITNWDTSFGWGDHKGLYLETETDPTVPQYVKSITQADINKWNNPPTGGGNDPRITNKQITNWDVSFGWGDHSGLYVETETDPTVPQYVKNITQAEIDKWNTPSTGGGAVDSVNGKTGVVTLTNSDISGGVVKAERLELTASTATRILLDDTSNAAGKKYIRSNGGKLEVIRDDYGRVLLSLNEEGDAVFTGSVTATTSFIGDGSKLTGIETGGAVDSVNGKTGAVNLTYSDVGAQVAGSYATASHNHTGVYALASHTHSYAPVGASYTKAESDNKYQPKGATSDAFPWTGRTAVFNGTASDSTIKINNSGSRGPEIALVNGATATSTKYLRAHSNELQVLKSNYGGVIFRVDEDSNVKAKDFLASSDERLKEDIGKAPLGVIDQIDGSVWTWREGGAAGSGVIAQQIESVLPHLVQDDDEGMKSVNYSGLIGYLIEEIKDLKLKVADLEGCSR